MPLYLDDTAVDDLLSTRSSQSEFTPKKDAHLKETHFACKFKEVFFYHLLGPTISN